MARNELTLATSQVRSELLRLAHRRLRQHPPELTPRSRSPTSPRRRAANRRTSVACLDNAFPSIRRHFLVDEHRSGVPRHARQQLRGGSRQGRSPLARLHPRHVHGRLSRCAVCRFAHSVGAETVCLVPLLYCSSRSGFYQPTHVLVRFPGYSTAETCNTELCNRDWSDYWRSV